VTQNRWSETKEGKKAAKALSEAGAALYQEVLAPVQGKGL